MNILNDALVVIVPLAYLCAIGRHRSAEDAGRAITLGVLLALHAGLVGARFAALGHLPFSTLLDVLSVLALLMTAIYAGVSVVTRDQATGRDVLVVPFCLVLVACAFGGGLPEPMPQLASAQFVMHTVPAVGAIAAVLVSGVYGLLYIRLERRLRTKQFDALFRRLPDLQVLAALNFRSALTGFLLATAAIGYGATLYADRFDRVDITEPKIAITLFVWSVLLLMSGGVFLKKLSDRAAAWVATSSAAVILLSLVVGLLALVTFPMAG